MTTPTPNRRWYHLTPDRFFVGLLAVQVFLLLSERFQWFAFNEQKGYTVLVAVGVVCLAVLLMLFWGLVCLCLRRRFQFGVRSLLVFLVAVSVPLGWFAWEMEKARTQREAVEAILGLGCVVRYDYDPGDPFQQPTEPPAPAWLRSVLGDAFFCDVASAHSAQKDFGDDDLKNLVDHLKELTDLKRLDLGGSQVSDTGLARLKELTNLEVLDLSLTPVSDHGLAHLQTPTKLRELNLGGTGVTDSGLAYLGGFTDLQWLALHGTHVTDEGVKKLQEALPNCEIIR